MVILSGIVAGLVASCFLLLPCLAIALSLQHGRYLPVWVAAHGTLVPYGVHVFSSVGLAMPVGIALSLAISIGVMLALHKFVFLRLIDSRSSLAALLAGVGLIQVYEAIFAIYGDGKSQQIYVEWNQLLGHAGGAAFFTIDAVAFLLFFCSVIVVYVLFHFTHTGMRARLILSNRIAARHLGLPILRLDTAVLSVVATLMGIGALLYGVKYDLQPQMMQYPGIVALTASIAVGPGKWLRAPLVAVAMQILVSTAGRFSGIAEFQRAIPFVFLVAVLLFISWRRPGNE